MEKYKIILFILKWLLLGPIAYIIYKAAYSHQWDLASFVAILFLGIDKFYIKDPE